ncbi:S8 family peptidase [Paenibacillus aquistagni]|uniref:Subtilase family protein n=1 Tax=Paenibacillus aquistagni TaxID=1852522 RepID=A0A1X7IDZ9_9BACL|nr:S8 family peptidase [Paenibacillus aquistagni]SMG12925.1 Subtilase family protein [Paenibacillus aquistagni]
MRKGTVIGLTALGIAVLAVPLLWNSTGPSNKQAKVHTASAERISKQHILQQDVNITRQLSQHDAMNDIQTGLAEWSTLSAQQLTSKIRSFVDAHPHVEYVYWINKSNKQAISSGSIPHKDKPEVYKKLTTYIRAGERHVSLGKEYRSPNLQINGKQHVVIGIPKSGAASPFGVVAIVNQQVVENIRNHQLRNLRMVPYPREHKYQVKSVDTNSMKDIAVKDGEDNQGTSHYYKDELVVRFRTPPTEEQLNQIKQDISCTHVRKSGYTYIFKSKAMGMEELKQYFSQYDPMYTEPHYLYMTNDIKRPDGTPTSLNARTFRPMADNTSNEPNDVFYKPYQWNLPLIKANEGWSLTKGSGDVTIAVVDTGVDTKHWDLKSKLLKGYNVIDPNTTPNDDVGHGTHVAGIIGAEVNNHEGIAGMTWNNPILPVKVLDSTGAGTSYSVAEGIIWATDQGAKVINLSLGNYADGAFLHDAVKYAYDKDVVLVAATGNDNTSQPGFPAAYPEVFAVSATNQDNTKASYSNYGNYVDVVAPGTSIASTYPDNQYAALSGTSMAGPHVSALAGLIRSINPSLRNTEVYDIMRQSAADLGSGGKDNYFGYGAIDVERALSMASQRQSSLSMYPQNVDRKLSSMVSRFLNKLGSHR